VTIKLGQEVEEKEEEEAGNKEQVQYVTAFSRLLLQNSQFFFGFFQKISNSFAHTSIHSIINTSTFVTNNQPVTVQQLLGSYISHALAQIESMPELPRKKMVTMSLLTLVPHVDLWNSNEMYSNLCLLIITSIGIMQDEEGDAGPAWRAIPTISEYESDDLYLTQARAMNLNLRDWRLLYRHDPVNSSKIRQFLIQGLHELQSKNPQMLQSIFQQLPPQVIKHLQF